MQEEVENRTVSLAISTTKLTGRALVGAFKKYLQGRARARASRAAPRGKMTVGQLVGQGQGAQQIDIADTGIRDFERILNSYGVDYALRKDPSQDPPRYMVFFKARDADVLTAAFREYSKELGQRETRPSVRKELERLRGAAREAPGRVREKRQERER